MKAKTPASVGAPSAPAPRPPSAGKLARPKAKRRPGRSRAQGGPGTPAAVAGRPPTAPEDFSRNWKALQELLRQKSQVPEEPPASRMGFKKPKVVQPNRKETSDRTETAQKTTRGPVASASKKDGKLPVAVTKTSGAEHKKGAKRTHGDVSPQRGGGKHKRRAREAAVASAPPAPTEDDIWFDDVDPADIEAALGPEAAMLARRQLGQGERRVSLVKEQAFSGLTKALALDCEMVGVGPKGEDSIVARVSVVNQYGKCVYDKYVTPAEPVTDYRTAVSGIRPENLKQGEKFEVVKQEVAEMLKGRILVGHALHHDLKVLFLEHPKKKIRDTQKYKPFKSQVKSGRPSLKQLSEKILGIKIQEAEHCSVQDAQAAMRLYTTVKRTWESTARDRRPPAAAPDPCKEHA